MAIWFIIQRNCRGLTANWLEPKLKAQKYNAPVICLHKTNLKDDQMTLKGYVASGTIDDMDIGHMVVSLYMSKAIHLNVL